MSMLNQLASAALLVILATGLAMLFRMKNRSEKIMVSQFLATVSIGWLLLQGQLAGRSYFFDVALLFALLATLTTVAFVHCQNDGDRRDRDAARR